jgi:hypothetical protein
MQRELIEQYAADADLPHRAIAGLTREELNAYPVPGTWSIQQIVIHLMDSDLIAGDRMKRVIAEDRPTLLGYNETLYSQRLFHDQLDPEMACDLFAKNRLLMTEILRRLPDEAFERVGCHNEVGAKPLSYFVQNYIDHVHHHLKFIEQKRKLLGKPLAL